MRRRKWDADDVGPISSFERGGWRYYTFGDGVKDVRLAYLDDDDDVDGGKVRACAHSSSGRFARGWWIVDWSTSNDVDEVEVLGGPFDTMRGAMAALKIMVS